MLMNLHGFYIRFFGTLRLNQKVTGNARIADEGEFDILPNLAGISVQMPLLTGAGSGGQAISITN
jgi:hypothetical protein